MKKIWKYIDQKDYDADTKYNLAVLLFSTIYALTGLLLWLVIRIWVLSSVDWMLCFMGYPAVVSCVITFIYSASHSFHNGKYLK